MDSISRGLTILRNNLRANRPPRSCAITLGNFDGVHAGHRHLVKYLVGLAAERDLEAGVVTFYPDPVRVLRPDLPMPYLMSLEERIQNLLDVGADFVAPVNFCQEIAQVTARDFLQALKDELSMDLLIVGPDARIGRKQEAGPEDIIALGHQLGFSVMVLKQRMNLGAMELSSTAIRQAVTLGDVEEAATRLGRSYSVRSDLHQLSVHPGLNSSTLIGYPRDDVAIPPAGTYRAVVQGEGGGFQANAEVSMTGTFRLEASIDADLGLGETAVHFIARR